MNSNQNYEAVIGLEVHAQLSTNSKLFCGDSTVFGAAPNTEVSAISLAQPGTLPVMNEKAIELAVKLGLAMNCEIVRDNYFARKNYFYPDLPKGYQISQHTAPICVGGQLNITTESGGAATVILNRIHLEEDAGKSLHDVADNFTAIDLNRAGMPLVEIVTEPCLHSAEEAFAYLTSLRKLVRWLNVCDGNMEEGSMRCDANISVRPVGDTNLYRRVEVKNLNSIRNVKRAIEVEVERLIKLTVAGEEITQETRSYNADNNSTFSLRSKEDADDYRYFPEPDLPAFYISEEYINEAKAAMPMLPEQLASKYQNDYELTAYDAAQLTMDKEESYYFEETISFTKAYKAVANWMTGPVKNYCREHDTSISQFPISPARLATLADAVNDGKINFNVASAKVMPAMIEDAHLDAIEAATKLNLLQVGDENELQTWINEVLTSMPEKVNEYKKGKKGLIGLFVGEIKRKSKGKADMGQVNKLLTEALEK